MKPTILVLHYRNGRIESRERPTVPRFLPSSVVIEDGGRIVTRFNIGHASQKFAHVKGREELCRVAEYWEEVTPSIPA